MRIGIVGAGAVGRMAAPGRGRRLRGGRRGRAGTRACWSLTGCSGSGWPTPKGLAAASPLRCCAGPHGSRARHRDRDPAAGGRRAPDARHRSWPVRGASCPRCSRSTGASPSSPGAPRGAARCRPRDATGREGHGPDHTGHDAGRAGTARQGAALPGRGAASRARRRPDAGPRPALGQDAGRCRLEDGIDQDWLRSLAGHWADGYDWRAAEAEINQFGNTIAAPARRCVEFSGRARPSSMASCTPHAATATPVNERTHTGTPI